MRYEATLISLLCAAVSPLGAVRADQPGRLSAPESRAVQHCLSITLACQLPDGGITMVNHGRHPGAPVWIGPYFCDYVAQSWLAAYDQTKDKRLLEAARQWIEWSCNHLEPEGFRYDYTGTVGDYASNGKVDAWDSSAAGLLVVVSQFGEVGGTITPEMRAAAKAALRCIRQCTDTDGLTWAKPTYKVKYIMDKC